MVHIIKEVIMEKIEKSSGNIFEDLGFENPEEELAKAKLIYTVNKIIEEKGLKQKEAAQILGIDQPKISHLKNGRLSLFSIDRLLSFLRALDRHVEIVISDTPKNSAGITVIHDSKVA